MSNIGYLKPVRNGAYEELHGEIKTLQMSIKVKFVPDLARASDLAPDYKIYAGQDIEIGAAWKKTKHGQGGAGFEFLSITMDDPSLPDTLNVAAFRNDQNGWDITWRRRQDKSPSAA